MIDAKKKAVFVILLAAVLLWALLTRNLCVVRSCCQPVWPVKQPIPRVVWRTTHLDPTVVPDLFGDKSAGWDVKLPYNDEQCEQYLQDHFPARMLKAFKGLKGAHKADLWRYAVLWREGGLYCDIKSIPWISLNSLVERVEEKEGFAWYTVVATDKKSIFNGIIATPPNNPIILAALEDACSRWTKIGCKLNYHRLVQELGRLVKDVYGKHSLQGAGELSDGFSTLLLDRESCNDAECSTNGRIGGTAKDRYGMCCNAYDSSGVQTWQVRDPSYPWG